jgi:twitching motility protein PilT
VIDDRGQPRTAAGAASVTFVDLRSTPVDPRAAETVPPQVAEHLGVLPIAMRDGALVVAVTEPIPTEALDEVRALTGHQVTPVLTAPADLGEAISRYAAAAGPDPAARPDPVAGAAVSGNLNPNARTVALNQPGMAGGLGLAAGTPPEAPGLVAPPPVNAPAAPAVNTPAPAAVPGAVSEVRAGRGDEPVLPFSMNGLLEDMLETGASDLHLTVGVPPMIRLFGELKPMPDYPRLGPNELRALVYSILPQRQREKFETELELDCSHAVPGKARFRLNVYQQRESVGAAFRVIPVEPKPLEELGVPPQIANFARLTRGLILVTGPTGSGKSTTLAGLVDLANRERSDHIVTVEDPIEFLHRHKGCIINQREVGEDTRSFANALKHVLRQDPDIILIGELRDLETISIALTAAETGHLVFATLHTQDAPQTIDRVIDVFPTNQQQQVRVQLAGALQGILCQQLVPTADGAGRAVAVEVLVATPAVRNLIRDAKTHQVYSAMQAGGKFGMQTMDQHLADLVRYGRITYDQGLERCHHVEDYNRLCGRG